ncbi:MAG: DM13 domain-containing protein [Acidimicrobiales bacterium]
MTIDTPTPPATSRDDAAATDSLVRRLIGRITRFEILVGAVIAAFMLLLVILEPDILEAPFENERTVLFTVGGSALAAVAFVAMLWFRVPAVLRVIVLVVPFAIVNWWLLSPYFIDDVVDESFSTSIAAQLADDDETPAAPAAPGPETGEEPTTDPTPPATDTSVPAAPVDEEPTTPADESTTGEPTVEEEQPAASPAEEEPPAPPPGPVLLGAGSFVGLAGHDGTGDAGIFENPDGSLVLRFENFDIQNGPDLEVYLVPGADQTSLSDGSIHLGALKGNVGDQNYELQGTELAPGAYTALVWCEAFSVEFVGATIVVGA